MEITRTIAEPDAFECVFMFIQEICARRDLPGEKNVGCFEAAVAVGVIGGRKIDGSSLSVMGAPDTVVGVT